MKTSEYYIVHVLIRLYVSPKSTYPNLLVHPGRHKTQHHRLPRTSTGVRFRGERRTSQDEALRPRERCTTLGHADDWRWDPNGAIYLQNWVRNMGNCRYTDAYYTWSILVVNRDFMGM